MNRIQLKELYCQRLLSMTEVANELKTTQARVLYWLKKHDIPRRSWQESSYVKQNPQGDPFTLPTKLNAKQKRLLLIGLSLYWAEGSKGKYAARLANLDHRMLFIFVKFLREICQINDKRLYVYVRVHKKFSLDAAKKYWSEELNIPEEKVFVYPHTDKRSQENSQKSPYGLATVEFHNTKFKKWLDCNIDKMAKQILSLLFAFGLVSIAHAGVAESLQSIVIKKEEKSCVEDSDCTKVDTLCDRAYCECGGEPINKKFYEEHRLLINECREKFRAEGKLAACDMVCPQNSSNQCINNECQIIIK